jgi:hypothetical protein
MSYRFGKKVKKSDYRTLRLGKYMTTALLPPLEYWSTLANVYVKLGIYDPTKLFPMDGNDKLGDCVMAAAAHGTTLQAGMIGKKLIPESNDVVTTYMGLTNGQDSGLVMLDTAKVWKNQGLFGSKILGFAAIMDPTDHTLVKQAISLFGGLYVGFQCQENVVKDFDAGIPWTPGTLTNDGHGIFITDYDPDYVTALTWGDKQKGTWEWWDACVDEAYAILPVEASDPNFAPGFDSASLMADLSLVGNINP